MKTKMKNAILSIMLAAVIAVPVINHLTNSAAAQDKNSKVTYAPIPAGTYNLDPAHGVIGFDVRHLEINWVEGRFKDFTGTVNYDDKDITKSTVAFTAKIDSVDTGIAPRDKHLKTADFFDAEKFPEMSFKSTSVDKKGKTYILHGDLTIKGVTKQVEFPFTITGGVKDPWGNTRFGIEAHTRINRRDYGINYGSAFAGGLDVGNDITVNLQLEAVKPEPKK